MLDRCVRHGDEIAMPHCKCRTELTLAAEECERVSDQGLGKEKGIDLSISFSFVISTGSRYRRKIGRLLI